MSEEGSRFLALDLGEVRIGLALSDPLAFTAQPLDTLRRIGPQKDIKRIAELARENEVGTIVVGLPLLLSGKEGQSAAAAREFAARLRRVVGRMRVVLWDERLTTAQAERTMIAGDVRRKERRKRMDAMAAVLILQSYLDYRSAAGTEGSED